MSDNWTTNPPRKVTREMKFNRYLKITGPRATLIVMAFTFTAFLCGSGAAAGQSELDSAINRGMDNIISWSRLFMRMPAEQAVNRGHPVRTSANIRHDVGRAIDALLRGSEATGKAVPPDIESTLRAYLFASMDNPTAMNGAYSNVKDRIVFHAHDIRESILALTALIKFREDDEARQYLDRLLAALDELIREDGTFDPDVVASMPQLREGYFEETAHRTEPQDKIYNLPCWTRGRWIMALSQCYRETKDPRAKEIAERIVRLVRRKSFTKDGKIAPDEFFHTHSITGTVHGLIEFGLLTEDEELLLFAKRVFDNGLPEVRSSYGWSFETRGGDPALPGRGEINNTGDMIQAAILLGLNGHPEYFQVAERFIRSHLLPSQNADGGWGFPSPNDQSTFGGSILDITAGAVQALCESRNASATRDDRRISINLLFDDSIESLQCESELPRQGRVTVRMKLMADVRIRTSSWLDRKTVRIRVDGDQREPVFEGPWLIVKEIDPNQEVVAEFSVGQWQEPESIYGKPYQLLWRGDQLMALSPKGGNQSMLPSVEEYLTDQ